MESCDSDIWSDGLHSSDTGHSTFASPATCLVLSLVDRCVQLGDLALGIRQRFCLSSGACGVDREALIVTVVGQGQLDGRVVATVSLALAFVAAWASRRAGRAARIWSGRQRG